MQRTVRLLFELQAFGGAGQAHWRVAPHHVDILEACIRERLFQYLGLSPKGTGLASQGRSNWAGRRMMETGVEKNPLHSAEA